MISATSSLTRCSLSAWACGTRRAAPHGGPRHPGIAPGMQRWPRSAAQGQCSTARHTLPPTHQPPAPPVLILVRLDLTLQLPALYELGAREVVVLLLLAQAQPHPRVDAGAHWLNNACMAAQPAAHRTCRMPHAQHRLSGAPAQGSRAPSSLRPSPLPLVQPIFCSILKPMLPSGISARVCSVPGLERCSPARSPQARCPQGLAPHQPMCASPHSSRPRHHHLC